MDQSIDVVNVRESAGVSHMASDRPYYKRYNFEVLKMEEYEVRQSYSRQTKTELTIVDPLVQNVGGTMSASTILTQAFLLRLQVKNIGNSIETQDKMEVWIPEKAQKFNNAYVNEIRDHKIRDESGYTIFSVPNSSPLFQDELTTLVTARIAIHKKQGFEEIRSMPVRIKLYYTNGVQERDIFLLPFLEVKGKPLDEFKFDE